MGGCNYLTGKGYENTERQRSAAESSYRETHSLLQPNKVDEARKVMDDYFERTKGKKGGD